MTRRQQLQLRLNLIYLGAAIIMSWPVLSPLFANLSEVPHITVIYDAINLIGGILILLGGYQVERLAQTQT